MTQSFGHCLRKLRAGLRTQRHTPWRMPSQGEFAERFGLTVGAVRDAEQGRVSPSRAFRVLVAAIELDELLNEKAALLAGERWRAERAEAGEPSSSGIR